MTVHDNDELYRLLSMSQPLLDTFGLQFDWRHKNRSVIIRDVDDNKIIEWNNRSGKWLKNGGGIGKTSNYFEIIALCLKEKAQAQTVIERTA